MEKEPSKSRNFIEQIIDEDQTSGKHQGRVHTRFPPEPNGYLHIGHAKSICLNFGLGEQFGGKTNLRFDDTNPVAEDVEYVESIKKDVHWLGFEWDETEYFTSDYFDWLYELAVKLVKEGNAYVDDQTAEQIAEQKGTPTEPGQASPFRDRTPDENLLLLEGMKNGDFKEGEKVLRAKIDMASSNMHMRDPLIYRIKFANHHRTGDKWCIYPMYDFAHGQSDAKERITHSICTLEFEVHRPLYEWFIEKLELFPSRQIEFARLNLNYTIMSKRKLRRLVEDKVVSGWDDPRMPTISGLRRRGYSPESIRNFCDRVGIAKRNNVIDVSLLEFSVREHLNKVSNRMMAVLDPIELVITNLDDGHLEMLATDNNPEDESAGQREMPFSNKLYIERNDFMENPPSPKKFFRLGPDRMVRLKSAYIVHCNDYEKDSEGNVTKVFCTYVANSKSGQDESGLKVKGTIHWVSQAHAVDAEVRMYDRLFEDENPDGHKDRDFMEFLNKNSLEVRKNCKLEPALAKVDRGERLQFQRLGYFCADEKDHSEETPVFNRTVTLRDSWAKSQKK